MDNKRKNRWRREEASRVREQRIIAGYVELKHPEVYKEAAGFYNLLNAKYPTKNDLRKTNEYEWLKTDMPDEITKKYYKRKQYPNIKKANVAVKLHNPTTNCSDNMQLVIPLMECPVTTTAQEAPNESAAPGETTNEQPQIELMECTITTTAQEAPNESAAPGETTNEQPQIELMECTITTTAQEVPNESVAPVETTNSFIPTVNEEIPDSVLEEIMEGLRQDPFLQDFFEDIDIEFDEISPLERELETW